MLAKWIILRVPTLDPVILLSKVYAKEFIWEEFEEFCIIIYKSENLETT